MLYSDKMFSVAGLKKKKKSISPPSDLVAHSLNTARPFEANKCTFVVFVAYGRELIGLFMSGGLFSQLMRVEGIFQ